MGFRKFAPILAMTVISSALCMASVEKTPPARDEKSALSRREQQMQTPAIHDSHFSAMSRLTARTSCEAVNPPEALATPDPLIATPSSATKVTVSFIIGTDGRVHSPLILESVNPAEDRIVLDAVRTWRYRPATCNGVPTEAEGKIAFSSR